jgi:hypothetical protein
VQSATRDWTSNWRSIPSLTPVVIEGQEN